MVKVTIHARVTRELQGEYEAETIGEALHAAAMECRNHGEIVSSVTDVLHDDVISKASSELPSEAYDPN